MNDNIDINQTKPALSLKWTWLLFCFYAAGVAVSVASEFFTNDGWLTWVSKGILMVTILCLLQLTSANIRYCKAALLNTLSLGCSLIPLLLSEPVARYLLQENMDALDSVNLIFQAVTLAAWALSLLAVYQRPQRNNSCECHPFPELGPPADVDHSHCPAHFLPSLPDTLFVYQGSAPCDSF